MKTTLFISLSLCFTLMLNSQNVWTGNVDDSWSDPNNWSGNVPNATEDVLIPPGFVVTIDTPANIRSIEVQGDPTINATILNVSQSLIIAFDSEFEDNVVVNWVSGDLVGPGMLQNSGTINLSFTSFDLTGSMVLNNSGEINMVGGNIGIISGSVLNNSSTGTIDFKQDGGMFGATSADLFNFGTIKTSFPDPLDEAFMACDIINQDGVFQIDSGTLNINNTVMNISGAEFNIAAGAELNLNSPMDGQGVFFGNVNGNLNWLGDLTVASSDTVVFNFTGNNTITNIGADLFGGGTLTNLSAINLDNGNLQVRDASIIINEGTISLSNGADLLIGASGTVNNAVNGTISFISDGASIGSQGIADDSRVLNNDGLIEVNLPSASDEASILIKLNNNSSQINVNTGQLNLNYGGITLTNGVYNIGVDGVLNWSFPITVTGAMTGNLEGVLNWDGDLLVPSSASFDFSGNGFVNWASSDLGGGGIFTNNVAIIKPAGGNRRIDDESTFTNNGDISIQGGGSIFLTTKAILNNTASGVINLEIGNSQLGGLGALPHVINNEGLIQSNITGSNASAKISAQLSNSGVLDIIQNGLDFIGAGSLTNNASGVIKGNGTLTLTSDPADFVNNGTVAPGASPGVLTIVNGYSSNATALLQVELNGNNQGIDYDLLSVSGDVSLDGDIEVLLGFAPAIGDTFTVLNTLSLNDTINSCNLPATTTASFDGVDYEFSVGCTSDDEVVLSVTDSTLSLDSSNTLLVDVYPNPTSNLLTISGHSIAEVTVYDINSRIVLTTSSAVIDFSGLQSGLYFLKISDTTNRITFKKVIKR